MSEKTRALLKQLFETGDYPNQADFIDFIDSCVNKTDDSWSSVQMYKITANDGGGKSELANLNHNTPGLYSTAAAATNLPAGVTDAGFTMITGHSVYLMQQFKTLTADTIYFRQYNGTSWSSWKRIIDDSLVGVANGVAGLDVTGKVPSAQLPASVTGAMVYQGTWNATTNSPAIPSAASGNKGYYYKVSTAGSTNVDGINDWKVGDWIISNGTTWDKIDNTDQVTSVAGKTGAVTLTHSDISGDIPQAKVTNLTTDITAIQASVTDVDGRKADLTSIELIANDNESSTVSYYYLNTGATNVQLQLGANNRKRRLVIIKTSSSNVGTIVTNGSETIEGSGSITLNSLNEKAILYFDGTGSPKIFKEN